ncbi:hypothetical protein ACFC1T_08760 [Kitasatospora sp. NPDC056076]|uniref:hypothetical protein n=1 Tax=Kitasatospora sp. NPDC056076 TaxID=3345703 RepID=UPI0035E37C0A
MYAIGSPGTALATVGWTAYPAAALDRLQDESPVPLRLAALFDGDLDDAGRLAAGLGVLRAYGAWFDFTGLDVAGTCARVLGVPAASGHHVDGFSVAGARIGLVPRIVRELAARPAGMTVDEIGTLIRGFSRANTTHFLGGLRSAFIADGDGFESGDVWVFTGVCDKEGK